MDGFPVTIRLIDPPLHEFVPHERAKQEELAKELGLDVETVARRVEQLHEVESDAGASRMPIVHHVSGNSRDAGARDHRGRDRMPARQS